MLKSAPLRSLSRDPQISGIAPAGSIIESRIETTSAIAINWTIGMNRTSRATAVRAEMGCEPADFCAKPCHQLFPISHATVAERVPRILRSTVPRFPGKRSREFDDHHLRFYDHWRAANFPQGRISNTYQFQDAATYVMGKHALSSALTSVSTGSLTGLERITKAHGRSTVFRIS